MDNLAREKLETLDGSRGAKNKASAAVRRRDLAALLDMPKATAVAASGSVTVDDFNALLADHAALRAALTRIAERVK